MIFENWEVPFFQIDNCGVQPADIKDITLKIYPDYTQVWTLSLFFYSRIQSQFEGNETNLIKNELKDLIHLWETVRFSHLSSAFMTEVVETSTYLEAIQQTESYQNAKVSNGKSAEVAR